MKLWPTLNVASYNHLWISIGYDFGHVICKLVAVAFSDSVTIAFLTFLLMTSDESYISFTMATVEDIPKYYCKITSYLDSYSINIMFLL